MVGPGEGATVFGVDSSRPSGPTTNPNVDAVVEFAGFGEVTPGKVVVTVLEHGHLMWTTSY